MEDKQTFLRNSLIYPLKVFSFLTEMHIMVRKYMFFFKVRELWIKQGISDRKKMGGFHSAYR